MKATYALAIFLGTLLFSCKKEATFIFPEQYQATPADFLSGSKYSKLLIQVDYVEGSAPTEATIQHLKSFLQQRLNKPAGIQINTNVIPSPGKFSLSLDEIKKIEKDNRKLFPGESSISAYLLFINADYQGNTSSSEVLGLAYGPSSMVVFEKTVRDHSGSIGQPSTMVVESAVAEHEFGHILGLVNNGTPMTSSHQDEAHGHHCNNSNCLMYFETETTDMLSGLIGSNVPSLDNNCINDLKSNGGK